MIKNPDRLCGALETKNLEPRRGLEGTAREAIQKRQGDGDFEYKHWRHSWNDGTRYTHQGPGEEP